MISSSKLILAPILSAAIACSSSSAPKIEGFSGSSASGSPSSPSGENATSGGSSSGSNQSAAGGGAASSSSPAPGAPAPLPSSIASLQALTPAQLAEKIYSAIGPNMTLMTPGKNGAAATGSDYLTADASDFVGAIASDPTAKYASAFSIGYFMALAGLANVVGTNYKNALTAKGATPPTNDCREEAGAEAILQAVAPAISTADTKTIGAALVTACTADPASAISAVVQSYSMAVNN